MLVSGQERVTMILRALFWIAVVGVLMPHEPDLGLGRPGTSAVSLLPAPAAAWVEDTLGAPRKACAGHAQACAATLSAIDSLQRAAVSGLAQVKADIEESRRARALHGVNG